jgi:uncharacterized protein (DUF849 family)
MARKVMITCAVTGGADSVSASPAVPYKPADIARECLEAAKAGAAITHIHVRDPETGKPSMAFELYDEVVKRIREKNDNLIINLTTGPGARLAVGDDFDHIGKSRRARREAQAGGVQPRYRQLQFRPERLPQHA